MSFIDPTRNAEIFDNIVADLKEFIEQAVTTETTNPILEDGTKVKNYALEVDKNDPNGPTVLLEYGGPTTTLVWSDAINAMDTRTTATLTRSINNEKLGQHVFRDPIEVHHLALLFFGSGLVQI